MITTRDLSPGDTVMVRGNFGTAAPTPVTVLSVHENIKRGLPGIDYTDDPSDPNAVRWAYLHQVDSIVSKGMQSSGRNA